MSVPVATVFIDKYMPGANPTFVKVYLYALRLCYAVGFEYDNKKIAEALDILESDVRSAFKYWAKQGIVKLHEDGVEFIDLATYTVPEKPEKPHYKSEEISVIMGRNSDLKQVVRHAEDIFGKTLSINETGILLSFYDWLGLPAEVILMLLEHCASLQKTSMRYAEKVAITWSEEGIDTIEKAKGHLKNSEKRDRVCRKYKRLLGITGRSLSDTEYAHILQWTENMQMGQELIKAAYERAVLATGAASFPYINAILQSWYKQDIKTVEELEKDSAPPAKPKKEKKSGNKFTDYTQTGSYDLEELERKSMEKLLKS